MPRNKHNKKRNTAFLYEALLKEVTKAIISGDRKVKKTAINILKESFAPKTVLSEELELYKTLLETKEMDNLAAEKIVFQVRQARNNINESDIQEAQNFLQASTPTSFQTTRTSQLCLSYSLPTKATPT